MNLPVMGGKNSYLAVFNRVQNNDYQTNQKVER